VHATSRTSLWRLRDYTTTLYREWQKNKDPINTLLIRFWGAP
jgi:hypothetical protein